MNALDEIVKAFQFNTSVQIGKKLGVGEHMVCYEWGKDSNYVVKFFRTEFPVPEWGIGRRQRSLSLAQQRMSPLHILPTRIVLPNKEWSLRYAEVQPRVHTTAQSVCLYALKHKDFRRACNLIRRVFKFEMSQIWARGLLLQDTKSYLNNIGIVNGEFVLFDFCSLDCNIELSILFFQGPWRIFRIEGTIKQFKSVLGHSPEVKCFLEWYRKEAYSFYSLKRFISEWQRDLSSN